MKTGFVLEGGAMRGMYTAGVLDVLLENKIKVDCIVGVSAGALFGVNSLPGQNDRVIRYNKWFSGDKTIWVCARFSGRETSSAQNTPMRRSPQATHLTMRNTKSPAFRFTPL